MRSDDPLRPKSPNGEPLLMDPEGRGIQLQPLPVLHVIHTQEGWRVWAFLMMSHGSYRSFGLHSITDDMLSLALSAYKADPEALMRAWGWEGPQAAKVLDFKKPAKPALTLEDLGL